MSQAETRLWNRNRADIGGHRFFSKSDRVMAWWRHILPLQGDPEQTDRVMLSRTRLSRVLFERRLYDYPISLSVRTVANLGLIRTAKIGASYLRAQASPIQTEQSLEDFLINRFGRELYGHRTPIDAFCDGWYTRAGLACPSRDKTAIWPWAYHHRRIDHAVDL